MLEPHGPLPPEIYWRRRALALGVAVLVVIVVVAMIVIATRGGGGTTNAAQTSALPTTTSSSDVSLPPSQAPTSPIDTGSPNVVAPVSVPPKAPVSAPPSAPVPLLGVAGGPCPDTAIAVVASADKAQYKVGDEPKFSAVVTNSSAVKCTRDIGTGMQQILVYSLDGKKRIWSNFDCSFEPGINSQMLNPGQQFQFGITWAAKNSVPGCQVPRVQVPVGSYSVVAALGEKRSDPVTFNVVP